MNTVTISGDALIVEPKGLDKLWSFTAKLEIPLAHVRGATIDPGITHGFDKGIRAPGLGLPNKWSGTFTKDGERHFWNASSGPDVVVIELTDEHYARLILTVDNAAAVVDEINTAITTAR